MTEDNTSENKPIMLPDILKTASKLYKSNIRMIILLVLIIILPLSGIRSYVENYSIDTVALSSVIEQYSELVESGEDTSDMMSELSETYKRFALYLLLVLVFQLFSLLLDICILRITKLREHDTDMSPITVNGLMDFSCRIFPKVAITEILSSLMCVCGLFLFVLPGIIMYIIFRFAICAVVFYDLYGKNALMLSSIFSRGKLKFMLIILLLDICGSLFSSLLVSLFGMIGSGTLYTMIIGIISSLVLSFIHVFIVFALGIFFIKARPAKFDPSLLDSLKKKT